MNVCFTLDRIENEFAVLTGDDGSVLNFRLDVFPESPKVGDVFAIVEDRPVFLKEETETRRKRISEKRDRFFNKIKRSR